MLLENHKNEKLATIVRNRMQCENKLNVGAFLASKIRYRTTILLCMKQTQQHGLPHLFNPFTIHVIHSANVADCNYNLLDAFVYVLLLTNENFGERFFFPVRDH